jgi:hypothetical protein
MSDALAPDACRRPIRSAGRRGLLIAVVACAAPAEVLAADDAANVEPATTFSATGYYYALRDEPDLFVGVAAVDREKLHLEARYNYEARDSGSVFVGWKFSGGEALSYEITPIAGVLFGSARGAIPGVEASVVYGPIDFYIEAEYVYDHDNHADSYYYAWSELGWKPAEWLRLGLVGQRTRVVQTGRELQRGVFAQFIFGKTTLSFYAFDPDMSSRYAIVALGIRL